MSNSWTTRNAVIHVAGKIVSSTKFAANEIVDSMPDDVETRQIAKQVVNDAVESLNGLRGEYSNSIRCTSVIDDYITKMQNFKSKL